MRTVNSHPFPSLTSYFDGAKLLIISRQLTFATLGQAWINLVRLTLEAGTNMGTEGFECLGVEVAFPAEIGDDIILNRFANTEMIANMQKVFFGEGANPLGHSYAALIRGPSGRNDLQDVISLLRDEPWSKRAVLSLPGNGDGKVPCINVIQFLIREGSLQVIYFARGQDAFRKFYADALCIASMSRKVASSLQLPAGTVTGFIGSCHVYKEDVPSIQRMLGALPEVFVNLPFAGKPAEGPLTPARSPSEGARENSQPRRGLANEHLATATDRNTRK
jgi:hypothetical protein